MKRFIAFTLAETILVMVIVGLIASFLIVAINPYNPTKLENVTKATRVLEEIDQIMTLIIAEHTPAGTLTYINTSQGPFSIEDENATGKFALLFKEYVNQVENAEKIIYRFREKKSTDYYNSVILDYDKSSTGKILKNTFSDFMISSDGVIWGFKTYNSCSATELLANPPGIEGKFSVSKICASIFYDVNAYKPPNKLGSDQFIIPINTIGTYYVK